jgi:hypothetical protein
MKTFRYSLPAVCLLALALPNLAAARPSTLPSPLPEPCPVAHIVLNVSYTCAAEFTLPASNGYKGTVSGDLAATFHGRGEVGLAGPAFKATLAH